MNLQCGPKNYTVFKTPVHDDIEGSLHIKLLNFFSSKKCHSG